MAVLTRTVPCSGLLWGDVSGGLDGDSVLLREGKERFRGFFGNEGQVHLLAGEGPLSGPAEQEQCLGEFDGSGVDGAEALVKLAAVAFRIVAGHVEKGLRDGQRGAQLMGGVGREPPTGRAARHPLSRGTRRS
jgi:hypothetical protein